MEGLQQVVENEWPVPLLKKLTMTNALLSNPFPRNSFDISDEPLYAKVRPDETYVYGKFKPMDSAKYVIARPTGKAKPSGSK